MRAESLISLKGGMRGWCGGCSTPPADVYVLLVTIFVRLPSSTLHTTAHDNVVPCSALRHGATRRNVNIHDCKLVESVGYAMTHADAGCLLIGLWGSVGGYASDSYTLSTSIYAPMVAIYVESGRALGHQERHF